MLRNSVVLNSCLESCWHRSSWVGALNTAEWVALNTSQRVGSLDTSDRELVCQGRASWRDWAEPREPGARLSHARGQRNSAPHGLRRLERRGLGADLEGRLLGTACWIWVTWDGDELAIGLSHELMLHGRSRWWATQRLALLVHLDITHFLNSIGIRHNRWLFDHLLNVTMSISEHCRNRVYRI